MRVLITGGAGFIGHHLIHQILQHTNWEIVSLDRLDTSGTLGRLAEVLELNKGWEEQADPVIQCSLIEDWKQRLTVVWHDLKAPINDYTAEKIGKIDYIFHLAAGSHVDRSIDNPMEFIMDNVVGTCNILDFARNHLSEYLKLFLYFSTDEVFGTAPEGVFYKEDDRYRSGNPYSASKAGAEELCIAYQNTYGMPVIITHTMNVFGTRQHPEKFIPLVIKRVRDGEKVYIHSNAECTKAGSRHYISADDVADAVLFLVKNFKVGEKYNIVGKRETDNLELCQIIADIMDGELIYEMVDFHSARPGHDLRYALCGDKMRELGWEPSKSLNDRLREVVEWTLENKQWLMK